MTPPALVPALNPNFAWLLWETSTRRDAHPAIVERERTTTYRDVRGRAAAFARALLAAGLRPGGRVAILLDRGADAAAAFFGTLAAGGVGIMVNETLRTRQVEHILRHGSVSVLIASAEVLERLPDPLAAMPPLLPPEQVAAMDEFEPIARVGADVAQIIYTSGSTGLPKGVTLAHANLWAGVRAVTSYVGIRADDRIASLLPFSFDYGLNQLLCAVASGAALVVERSPIPRQVVECLREREVTVLAAVPPLWLQLLQTRAFTAEPLPALRAMTNTGGRVPTDAVARLRRAQPQAKLFLMYGLTEAFRATYLPPEEVERRPDSIGRAIPGSEIMVLRDDLTPCAPGEVGELVQRGATVALGYWNDPEATARVFRPNPLRPAGAPESERVVFSGDLVRTDEEGFLYFVGRRDRMIKTLGYRVSPDEVIDALHASGEVVEAVVGTDPDEQRGERIVAYVVLKPEGSLERLAAFCGKALPRYMQIARFEVRENLPRTSSGKHDVAALAAP
jgi:amino acid adenylation domain-containing protein